jgi:hypothetical protein
MLTALTTDGSDVVMIAFYKVASTLLKTRRPDDHFRLKICSNLCKYYNFCFRVKKRGT